MDSPGGDSQAEQGGLIVVNQKEILKLTLSPWCQHLPIPLWPEIGCSADEGDYLLCTRIPTKTLKQFGEDFDIKAQFEALVRKPTNEFVSEIEPDPQVEDFFGYWTVVGKRVSHARGVICHTKKLRHLKSS